MPDGPYVAAGAKAGQAVRVGAENGRNSGIFGCGEVGNGSITFSSKTTMADLDMCCDVL